MLAFQDVMKSLCSVLPGPYGHTVSGLEYVGTVGEEGHTHTHETYHVVVDYFLEALPTLLQALLQGKQDTIALEYCITAY
jgi:hypothetical protein